MVMRAGPQRRLSSKELMRWNCGAEEDSWESLGLQGAKLVNPKGNQRWIFIGRTGADTEAPILWSPDVKNWRIGKDPDAGKDWGQEEEEAVENEMVGWRHQLSGEEFEPIQGSGDGQGNLVCCSSWSCQELDTTTATTYSKHDSAIKRNEFASVLVRWVLEPVIQSERSQKQENRRHILTYIHMESGKMVLISLFVEQQ